MRAADGGNVSLTVAVMCGLKRLFSISPALCLHLCQGQVSVVPEEPESPLFSWIQCVGERQSIYPHSCPSVFGNVDSICTRPLIIDPVYSHVRICKTENCEQKNQTCERACPRHDVSDEETRERLNNAPSTCKHDASKQRIKANFRPWKRTRY